MFYWTKLELQDEITRLFYNRLLGNLDTKRIVKYHGDVNSSLPRYRRALLRNTVLISIF